MGTEMGCWLGEMFACLEFCVWQWEAKHLGIFQIGITNTEEAEIVLADCKFQLP